MADSFVRFINKTVACSLGSFQKFVLTTLEASADCYSVSDVRGRVQNPFTAVSSCQISLLFLSTDMQTQICVVVVVSIAVMSILTAVLVVIFFVKGTNSRKPRAR